MRELMEWLPLLTANADGEPDLLASSPSVLLGLAERSEESAALINRGLSAVGSLIAYSTQEIEDGTIAYDAVEALGWLLAELGAVTAHCIELSSACRQARGKRHAD
jgi:hypothetical protein